MNIPDDLAEKVINAPAQTSDDWSKRAACAKENPEMFYPGKGAATADDAKNVCRRCPVSFSCLLWAVDTGEREGIWGGFSASGLGPIRRQRRRALDNR